MSRSAISAASLASPASAASTTMRASRGGSGNCRNRLPSAVMRPSRSMAPSSSSSVLASLIAGAGGGSRKTSAAGSATPQWARSSTKPVRSAARISAARRGLERSGLRLVPQPIADAGLGAPGAAAPLVGGGARHTHGLEPCQADVGLVTRHPRQARIDHHPHALDGQRGFGNRRGEHDLAAAGRRRRDGAVLDVGVERAIERHHVDRRVGDALAQGRLGAADLRGAGQEHQHRSGLGAQGPQRRVCDLPLDRHLRIAAKIMGLRPETRARRSRSPAHRRGACRRARRRWSPTSPGA